MSGPSPDPLGIERVDEPDRPFHVLRVATIHEGGQSAASTPLRQPEAGGVRARRRFAGQYPSHLALPGLEARLERSEFGG